MSNNEKLKKIINFKYIKKGKDTLQKKAVKALFAFLDVYKRQPINDPANKNITGKHINIDIATNIINNIFFFIV